MFEIEYLLALRIIICSHVCHTRSNVVDMIPTQNYSHRFCDEKFNTKFRFSCREELNLTCGCFSDYRAHSLVRVRLVYKNMHHVIGNYRTALVVVVQKYTRRPMSLKTLLYFQAFMNFSHITDKPCAGRRRPKTTSH